MQYFLTVKDTISGHGLEPLATVKDIAAVIKMKMGECSERLEMAAKDNPSVKKEDGKVVKFSIYTPAVWMWLGYAFGPK